MSLCESMLVVRYRRVPGHWNLVVKPDGAVWRHFRGTWCRARLFSDRAGYLSFSVQLSGRSRKMAVHTAVLLAFSGPRPEGMECRHLDGNNRNNRLENLCWGTKLENEYDKKRHGILGRYFKLTTHDVREIRRRHPGESQASLAREFGVTKVQIHYIVTGQRWRHVE